MDDLYIVVRHENVFDRMYEVRESRTVIGRGSSCQLRLPDPCISRTHAIVIREKRGLMIYDAGSRNRTVVNGQLIEAEAPLYEGSRAHLGPYELTFCFGMTKALREIENWNDESTHPTQSQPVKQESKGRVSDLTPAQARVYEEFVDGLSEKEIAAKLGISIHTVHDHAKAIYKSLSVSSRGELIADWVKRQTGTTPVE